MHMIIDKLQMLGTVFNMLLQERHEWIEMKSNVSQLFFVSLNQQCVLMWSDSGQFGGSVQSRSSFIAHFQIGCMLASKVFSSCLSNCSEGKTTKPSPLALVIFVLTFRCLLKQTSISEWYKVMMLSHVITTKESTAQRPHLWRKHGRRILL